MATFANVRINQLSAEATGWLQGVLDALDAKDVDAYTGFMADEVEVTFNNGDMAMRGRDAVREGLAQFWQGFGTLAHDELNVYGTDRNFVHEALNNYTTLDGRDVTIRAVAWIDRDDGGAITSLRIYNDQSPFTSAEGIGDVRRLRQFRAQDVTQDSAGGRRRSRRR